MQNQQLNIFSTYEENTSVQHLNELKLSYQRSSFIETYTGRPCQSSITSVELLRKIFDDNDLLVFESFYVLYFNRSMNLIGFLKIGQGGNDFCPVDVKRICSSAILSNASSVILAHNHPSGTTRPSNADIRITEKIRKALELFDIKVDDHIILTENSYYSFRDKGDLF